ncbi:hypothetical protein E5D57_008128 [Metarhizium anisopliae]|nr:hypothetical protein E5D57_008128 [Metarhizium anisopliae]
MRNTGFGVVSRRIRAEKTLKHLGTARIEVDALCFPDSDGPNIQNVKRLKNLFRLQHDLDPGELQNRIPAVIDENDLREALATSGFSLDSLLSNGQDYPTLHFRREYRLKCLRGEDRVEAAKQVFRSSDVRWVVDLFAAGLKAR